MSVVHPDNQNAQSTGQRYFSTISVTLFCNPPQSEISLSDLNDFSSPSFKKIFSDYWTLNTAIEKLFKVAFSQYSFSSRNLLVRHRKTNIIYPFHCFW